MCHRSPTTVAAAAATAVIALVVAGSADAALFYEFTFTGEVIFQASESPDHPWGGVEVGDPVFFSYVIDVEQEDQWVGMTLGVYDVQDVRLGFGGVVFEVPSAETLTVDTFGIIGTQEVEIEFEGSTVPGFPQDNGAFQLSGFDVLTDDSIPIDFVLDDFVLEHGVGYGDGIGLGLVSEFHEYSYQIVPGPGALSLSVGLLLLGGRRRRRP